MNRHTLPKQVVGIDLETTALQPEEGEIIEVAAIRFDLEKGEEMERFVRLCGSSRPLTTEITAITGITRELVEGKPRFEEIKEELRQFIGEDLVFAHNASFDLGWLRVHGGPLKNLVWDTFWLAACAWPEMGSYNLGSLANEFEIKSEGEHRAGADVLMTWELLKKIREELVLPKADWARIEEILHKSGLEQWRPLFSVTPTKTPSPSSRQIGGPLPLGQGEKIVSGVNDVKDVLGESGVLASVWPNFKHRKEQLEMANEVEDIIKDKKVGMIEAPTGIGKTLGYLTPVLLASHPKSPIVISTHTKSLQDQLMDQDLPRLLEALNLSHKVALLKGRSNYLCATCLDKVLQEKSFRKEDGWFLVKILVWLAKSNERGYGDLDRLNISHQSPYLLRRLHAGSLEGRFGCRDNNCPYQRAFKEAQEADLVVVNHSLLASWLMGSSDVKFSCVIVDEAHHLAAAAREATRIDLSQDRVEELVYHASRLAKQTGENLKLRIKDEGKQLTDLYKSFLTSVGDFIINHGRDSKLMRITGGVRRNSSWLSLAQQGSLWLTKLQFFVGLLDSLATLANDKKLADQINELTQELGNFRKYFSVWLAGDDERIQWAALKEEWGGGKREEVTTELNDVALVPGPVVTALVDSSDAVVLTSATLTVGGSFDYIERTLGVQADVKSQLSSSFDYKNQMMIYVVDDGLSPKDPDFDSFTATILSKLAILLGGRTLGLFTSHTALKSVYKYALDGLHKANIRLLAQRMTGGRQKILTTFTRKNRSVLLGTNSFWEGVDIPGDSLSCLVIPRLPWPVPTDPVLEALAGTDQAAAFDNMSVPEMLLRLRQGVGRLIRTEDDRGVVVILDGRWLGSSYYKKLIDSLPAATIKIGGANEIESTVVEWFGDEVIAKWQEEN